MRQKIFKIIIIVLWGISLLFAAYKHGQDKEGKYSLGDTIIVIAINIGLLWGAGLFD